MFRRYIHDLFTEGLGDIFFMKYYRFLQKNVKNVFIFQLLVSIHVVVYLAFLTFVGYFLFQHSFPL